jgi:putative phosphoribosyl transferase
MIATIHSEQVEGGPLALAADLDIPARARSLVLCAQDRGGCRHGSRNRGLTEVLHGHRLATLLFDLPCSDEAVDRRAVIDIACFGVRLVQALDWVVAQASLTGMQLGVFGAGAGATAVLHAAAARPGRVAAVVSCAGRHDPAAAVLARIGAPTLLVVGGVNGDVLELNRQTLRLLRCNKRLEVVPGATHLLEEPGTLSAVAELAASWFDTHLARGR